MQSAQNFILVLLGCLVLGALGFMLAVWTAKWPRASHGFLRLGDAMVTFILGVTGATMVVLVFRALGLLPSR